MNHYLGIEIGGTKLQIGVGADDGVLAGLWRGAVDAAAGPEGIRRQITPPCRNCWRRRTSTARG